MLSEQCKRTPEEQERDAALNAFLAWCDRRADVGGISDVNRSVAKQDRIPGWVVAASRDENGLLEVHSHKWESLLAWHREARQYLEECPDDCPFFASDELHFVPDGMSAAMEAVSPF